MKSKGKQSYKPIIQSVLRNVYFISVCKRIYWNDDNIFITFNYSKDKCLAKFFEASHVNFN